MKIQFKEIQFENVTNFSLSYSTMVSTIKKYGEEILSTPQINVMTVNSELSTFADDIDEYNNMKVFETVYPVSDIKYAKFRITDPNTHNTITTLESCSLKLQVFLDPKNNIRYARTVGCNNVVECGFELFKHTGVKMASYAFSNSVSEKVGKHILESSLKDIVLIDLDEMTAHTMYANELVRGEVRYVYNPKSLRGKTIESIQFI